jgi:hypothetical protein
MSHGCDNMLHAWDIMLGSGLYINEYRPQSFNVAPGIQLYAVWSTSGRAADVFWGNLQFHQDI